jgi:hypothetical protein
MVSKTGAKTSAFNEPPMLPDNVTLFSNFRPLNQCRSSLALFFAPAADEDDKSQLFEKNGKTKEQKRT